MKNAEYERKLAVAADIARAAWDRGGLDGMSAELASLRGLDADPVCIAEVERIYHRKCMLTLPSQESVA